MEFTSYLSASGVKETEIPRYAGYSAQHCGNIERAKYYYHQVLKFEEDDPVTYINLCKIYFDENKIDDAISVIGQARTLWPDNKDYTITELNIYLKAKRLDEYALKLEKAIIDHPGNTNLIR